MQICCGYTPSYPPLRNFLFSPEVGFKGKLDHEAKIVLAIDNVSIVGAAITQPGKETEVYAVSNEARAELLRVAGSK